MKKIINKPIIITVFLFLTLFLLGIFTSSFIVRDRLDHIVYGNKFLQIDREYESTITSEKDNLSTITIHLKNPALENTGDVKFQIIENENVIREVGFTGENIGDPGDVKLKFDPITDSSGKRYLTKIVVSQNEPKLSVFVDDSDNLGGWFYYRNQSGFMGLFKTFNSYIGRIFSDITFIVMWGTSVLLTSIVYYRKV